MKSLWRAVLATVAAGMCVPNVANAFSFVMSEPEYQNWPTYCQARYASIDAGKAQPFAQNYPLALIEQERQRLGAATFERVHHWCAGMTWLNRARLESDEKRRTFELEEAAREADFTLRGLPPDSIIIPSIQVTLGLICQEQKNYTCAVSNFEKAVEIRPSDPSPYSALALLYRERKDLNAARDILLKGDVAVNSSSPEIHYNLGLILLEIGDVDRAVEYAHKAYQGGFPLPGLRNKLMRLGRWESAGISSNKAP